MKLLDILKTKIDTYLINLINKAVSNAIDMDIPRDRQIEDVLAMLVKIDSKLDIMSKQAVRKTKVLEGKKK